MCDLLVEHDAEGLAALMRDHLLGGLEYCRLGDPASLGLAETSAESHGATG